MYCRNKFPIFFRLYFTTDCWTLLFLHRISLGNFTTFSQQFCVFCFMLWLDDFFSFFFENFSFINCAFFFISRRNLTTFFYFPWQLDNFFQKLFISCFHFTSFFFTELHSSWGGQSQEVFYAKKLCKKKFLQCKKRFLQLFQQPRGPRPQIKMILQQEHWARSPYPNERNRLNPISILSHQQYQVNRNMYIFSVRWVIEFLTWG